MQVQMPKIEDCSKKTRWAGKEPKNKLEPNNLAITSAGDRIFVICYDKNLGRYVCGFANGQGMFFRVSPANLKPVKIKKK